mgnify:CR=1 FL=1
MPTAARSSRVVVRDASQLASGLYVYRLETPLGVQARTMTVLK